MKNLATEIKYLINNRALFLAEKIVDLQYSRQPKFWKPYGSKGRQISIRDAAYHLPFLTEAIESDDVSIFTNYVEWVKKLFRGLKFPDSVMTETLKCTRDVIEEEFSPEIFQHVNRFIEAGLEQMTKPAEDSGSFINPDTPMGFLASQYIEALLEGDRRKATQIILDSAENGVPVKEIYLNIFQKSQYEIGKLWLENKISVAKEHFCSAATQQIMAQLYPYIFSTERKGLSMIAANVGGELHEIGLRMVADFFEMEGWDTYYLGANTPTSGIIAAIKEKKADVVGLSVSIPHHRSTLKDTISGIRTSADPRVKILIGGIALRNNKEEWKNYGADGYAADADEGIKLANNLMNESYG